MFNALRRWREDRLDVARLADALIEKHAGRAPIEARNLTYAFAPDDPQQRFLWRVVGRVEARLGVSRQADAATRYLEG
jgi:hypothetical protein